MNANVGKLNEVIVEFLDEAYKSPEFEHTWFINNDLNSGLFGSIKNLDSKEASTQIIINGTTIAAHVDHLRWTLQKTNSYLRGEKPSMIWSESWRVRNVNSDEWDSLIDQLKSEYDILVSLVAELKWTSNEQFKEILALIPHAAYHLGAIRQMSLTIKRVDA